MHESESKLLVCACVCMCVHLYPLSGKYDVFGLNSAVLISAEGSGWWGLKPGGGCKDGYGLQGSPLCRAHTDSPLLAACTSEHKRAGLGRQRGLSLNPPLSPQTFSQTGRPARAASSRPRSLLG